MDKARKKISFIVAVIVSAIFWFFLLIISSLNAVAIREDQYPLPWDEFRTVETPLLSPIGMVIIIGALVGLAIIVIKKKK